MKYCMHCNTAAEDPSKYCSACGGSDFSETPIDVAETESTAAFVDYSDQTPYNPDPSTLEKPKKSVGMIIVGIVVAVATVIALVASVILNVMTPYGKGETSDGVYTNEWANMQFELGEGWEELVLEKHVYSAEEGVECGIVAESDDAYVTVVFCEGWSGNEPEGYFEKLDSDAYVGEVDDTYTARADGDAFEMKIAGETFLVRKYYAEWLESGFAYYHNRYECVRIQGDYAIHISIVVIDGDEQFYKAVEKFKAIEE